MPPGLDLLDLAALPTGEGDLPRAAEPLVRATRRAILPTSGTTGVAKGVLLPHNHALHYAECTVAMRRMGPSDGNDHGFALSSTPTVCSATSSPPCSSAPWSPCRGRWRYRGLGHLPGPPAHDLRLLGRVDRHARRSAGPAQRRRQSGAGRLRRPEPPETARPFERRFGLHLAEGYGSTEAGIPLITPWDGSRVEEGSCGRAVTGYDVRLAGDGELLLRPHDPTFVMLGYVTTRRRTVAASPATGGSTPATCWPTSETVTTPSGAAKTM